MTIIRKELKKYHKMKNNVLYNERDCYLGCNEGVSVNGIGGERCGSR